MEEADQSLHENMRDLRKNASHVEESDKESVCSAASEGQNVHQIEKSMTQEEQRAIIQKSMADLKQKERDKKDSDELKNKLANQKKA